MSDIVETFYLAWENIMKPVPHRIFCSWHIDKAWRQNLTNIIGSQRKEKQYTVYKSLKVLQTKSSETEFNQSLKEFSSVIKNDPDTKEFGLYFYRTYRYRTTLWAYCYRKGLGTAICI